MQGQVMSVSIRQGMAFTVEVRGADGKTLTDPDAPRSFWRGVLPATQDYFLTITTPVGGTFDLRTAINPPGKALQTFELTDPNSGASLLYSDEFAPVDPQVPITVRGNTLLTLAFIDPSYFSPRTNLSEVYLTLAASDDPAVVSACTQAYEGMAEVITGPVEINGYTFTRGEFSGAAAGNRYDQVSFRTVVKGRCYELVSLVHSTNIGNYPPGTVVEYDAAALTGRLEAVIGSFRIQ
jgi:hypothetical protein